MTFTTTTFVLGHQDVCEALLEAGARIDETDNEGKAPLALAAQGGHTALITLFLDKYSAPCDQRPHDGKTALRYFFRVVEIVNICKLHLP